MVIVLKAVDLPLEGISLLLVIIGFWTDARPRSMCGAMPSEPPSSPVWKEEKCSESCLRCIDRGGFKPLRLVTPLPWLL